mmetsp:Transcript_14239/g.24111  ORF Transcript_14239/g.24111 Transcript_14239/m.24111 type:complete len:155 (+) Transcript_14239:1-465(+)
MSALMSLVPYTQDADHGHKQSRFTVNSFLLRDTRSDAEWLETSPPQSPERSQASGRASSRPVSRQSNAAPAQPGKRRPPLSRSSSSRSQTATNLRQERLSRWQGMMPKLKGLKQLDETPYMGKGLGPWVSQRAMLVKDEEERAPVDPESNRPES